MRYVVTLVLLVASRAGIAQGDEIDALRGVVAESADPVARREALDKLKPFGRAAVPALRELLAHPEPTVRSLAIAALGELSSPQHDPRRHAAWPAIPDMIRLLEDPDIRVRRSAAYSLGWFWGAPGEGPRRDESARSAAPILAACLSDTDPKLREYSARLLWRIGDVAWEAVPALIVALDDKDAAATYARKTLLYLGPPERAYTIDQLLAALEAQPSAPDIGDLTATARWAGSDESETRADLGLSRFEALLYLGRKATDPEAKSAAGLLLKLAEADHPAVRFHALAARTRLGLAGESPIPMLEAALSADEPDTAFWAAHALVELRGAEANKAVGVLAANIPEHETGFTPRGPTPAQELAMLKSQISTDALLRLGVSLPIVVKR